MYYYYRHINNPMLPKVNLLLAGAGVKVAVSSPHCLRKIMLTSS